MDETGKRPIKVEIGGFDCETCGWSDFIEVTFEDGSTLYGDNHLRGNFHELEEKYGYLAELQ